MKAQIEYFSECVLEDGMKGLEAQIMLNLVEDYEYQHSKDRIWIN